MPFFSIVMATRNRPAEFARALGSVLVQSCPDKEVIVVNDGSAAEHQSAYQAILSNQSSSCVRYFNLPPSSQGHGPSFVLNFGAAKADAPYLCFLDDDDYWTDANHLGRARVVLDAPGSPVDLYMTNQAAFLDGEQQPGPIWIEDLPRFLAILDNRPDTHGAHTVAVPELLQSQGFCHLNTLIVRRTLYQQIGGMEETIRWESDHDLYFRLIDRSTTIKYMPVQVARHNIPDPKKLASVTTALSEVERRLLQLRVFYRAQYLCRHEVIRAHARHHTAYTLKRIAEALAAAGRHVEAAAYAREALRIGPTLKWVGYTAWRTLRALASP